MGEVIHGTSFQHLSLVSRLFRSMIKGDCIRCDFQLSQVGVQESVCHFGLLIELPSEGRDRKYKCFMPKGSPVTISIPSLSSSPKSTVNTAYLDISETGNERVRLSSEDCVSTAHSADVGGSCFEFHAGNS